MGVGSVKTVRTKKTGETHGVQIVGKRGRHILHTNTHIQQTSLDKFTMDIIYIINGVHSYQFLIHMANLCEDTGAKGVRKKSSQLRINRDRRVGHSDRRRKSSV